ncbi:hypothetical protein [Serinicoccus sp. LYQ131]
MGQQQGWQGDESGQQPDDQREDQQVGAAPGGPTCGHGTFSGVPVVWRD